MKIIGKNAHVNVIYLSYMDSLYIVWRGLLFIIHLRQVQSPTVVIFNSSHVFLYVVANYREQVGINIGI